MSETEAERVLRAVELHLISLREMLPNVELMIIGRQRGTDAFVIVGELEPEEAEDVIRRYKLRRMQ